MNILLKFLNLIREGLFPRGMLIPRPKKRATRARYNMERVNDRQRYCTHCGDKLVFDLRFEDIKYNGRDGSLLSVTPVREYKCPNWSVYQSEILPHEKILLEQSPIKDKRVFMMLFPYMHEDEE